MSFRRTQETERCEGLKTWKLDLHSLFMVAEILDDIRIRVRLF